MSIIASGICHVGTHVEMVKGALIINTAVVSIPPKGFVQRVSYQRQIQIKGRMHHHDISNAT